MHFMCLVLVVANMCVIYLFCENHYLWSDATLFHMFCCAHPSIVCFVLWRSNRLWSQKLIMAHLPHMVNIFVRPHHPEPWRWQHDWEAHRHSYSGVVSFRLMRAHPSPGGWIPMTMQTVLTMDLSESNPFARPPPPPPPWEEEDLMDVDLLEDYIFRRPSEDSDREFHYSFVLVPPVVGAVKDV